MKKALKPLALLIGFPALTGIIFYLLNLDSLIIAILSAISYLIGSLIYLRRESRLNNG